MAATPRDSRDGRSIAPDVIARLEAAVGPAGAITDPRQIAPYCESWRDGWKGATPLIVRPATTAEVAEVVRICAEARVPIVPQGGNTGVTGGGQPHAGGSEILLSTGRLKRIRAVDTLNDTITVEAGVVLAELQRAAAAADRLFPLSLGAEGSCQIGGNIATNAGGNQVLRYGNMRALVLGLEVVLADGRVWDGLKGLRKDNSGYDMKQLFIGSEGTLGIITAAVLKLFPRPSESQTALIAVASPDAAVKLLGAMRAGLGDAITAFELIGRPCLDMVLAHMPGAEDPISARHDWYVLTELAGQGAPGSLAAPLADVLDRAMTAGFVADAAIAGSGDQAKRLWKMRDSFGEAQNRMGVGIKHDVSVPISAIPEFIARANAALAQLCPGVRFITFGHAGDGNLHYNPIAPPDWDGARFKAETEKVNRIVHDIVVALGGSISAEHGIGRLRLTEAERYKSPVELDLMRAMKRSLDPYNIMNPGKVLRA